MAKTQAPLLSFGASGSLAKSIVYGKWKGIPYARRHVVPANPQTVDQTETRDTFSWLNNVWRYFPSEVQEAWNAYASGQPLTGRNGLIKLNLSNLRTEADLTNFVFTPAAKSGPPAQAMVITPGVDQLSVALTAPSLPAGWSIVYGAAAAILDQDPQTGAAYESVAGTDLVTPYTIVLTGLTAATDYAVGGWFKYLRPDGSNAYGPSLMDMATPT